MDVNAAAAADGDAHDRRRSVDERNRLPQMWFIRRRPSKEEMSIRRAEGVLDGGDDDGGGGGKEASKIFS